MRKLIKETLRYLGYGKHQADDIVMALLNDVIEELSACTDPKSLNQRFPLTFPQENCLDFGCFQAVSKHLKKNLGDCEQVILFAATLGSKVDLLIQKYTKLQMSKAVVLQAASAALIEEYCDSCNDMLRDSVQTEGYYLRPRFSPGYGDFSIEHQKDFIRVLDTPKKIGLTLTDSLIMAPSKSVTAIIGVSRKPYLCDEKGCEVCQKSDCIYRRG